LAEDYLPHQQTQHGHQLLILLMHSAFYSWRNIIISKEDGIQFKPLVANTDTKFRVDICIAVNGCLTVYISFSQHAPRRIFQIDLDKYFLGMLILDNS
jgi:hypothetical protein